MASTDRQKLDQDVLRAVLAACPSVGRCYEPAALPARLRSDLDRANRQRLQTLLVEVIHRLRQIDASRPPPQDRSQCSQ